jgi:RNA polymerase sigma factor (sigma-70 family)
MKRSLRRIVRAELGRSSFNEERFPGIDAAMSEPLHQPHLPSDGATGGGLSAGQHPTKRGSPAQQSPEAPSPNSGRATLRPVKMHGRDAADRGADVDEIAAGGSAEDERASDSAAASPRGAGQQSDALVVARVLEGDVEAYALLVEKYQRAIFACAWQYLGTHADAEEAAQEAFVQGFEKLAKLREPRFFFPWVWRICATVAMKWRTRGRRIALGVDGSLDAAAPERAGGVELAERDAQILAALGKLPEEQRLVLVLRFWENVEYAAISEMTGVSEDALYQRSCRGLKKLRELLGDDFLAG